MNIWNSSTMEVLYLIYGIAFFMVGVVAHALPKRNTSWYFTQYLLLLSAFGILHGVVEFVEMYRLNYPDERLAWLSRLLLLASYLLLLEFGRRVWVHIPGRLRMPAPVVYCVAGLGIALLMKWTDNPLAGLATGTRWFVGAPAALLAGLALFAIPNMESRGNSAVLLRIIAVTFFCYSSLTFFLFHSDAHLPAWMPTQADFLAFTGIPVHLLRALCALVISFGFSLLVRKDGENILLHATAFESQAAIAITDKNTVILRVNNAFTEFTGYTEKEVVGRKISMLKSGRHDDAFFAAMWKSINRTGIWQGEILDRRKNGEIYPTLLTITAVKNINGVVTSYVGTHIDISKRKEAEAALENAEIKYRTLFEESPDGVVLFDAATHKVEDFNVMACRQLGYTKEDFALLSIFDFVAIELQEKTRQHIDKMLTQGADTFETILRTKGGEPRNTLVIAKIILLGGKSIIHAILRDVTEQKQIESQIQESEVRFRRLFEDAPMGIVVYRADGQCVMANEAVAAIIGATHAQVLQQNFKEIKSWRSSGMLDSALKTLSTGITSRCTVTVVSTFGKELELDCDFALIMINGKPHLLAMFNDITHLRRAEIKMKEAKEAAESAVKIKSEFLSSMSHEVRTPLNAIIGLTRLALDTELSLKQSDYLKKILTSSMSLLNIINDVLDFSKIEANSLKIENISIILEETLENTMSLFSVKAEEKGLMMACEVSKGVPAVITGDPYRLGQVLNNIIGNAIKFTERGEVRLKVEMAERSEESCLLRFTVADTGIGLSGTQIERLFTPFQQADGSISRKYGGTGLGLTISRKLVNLMGGDISVSSELGRGSAFIFTARFCVPISQGLQNDFVNLYAMKSLVVDDSPTSLESLKSFLDSWKFDVMLCTSGEECMRQLELADKAGMPFQLLLLDWNMPNMTGLEVARKIQENVSRGQLTASPMTILVTGYSQSQLPAEAADVKLDAMLAKPLRASRLYNTILRLQQPGVRKFSLCPLLQESLCRSTKTLQGARLLLVEDNEINQQVAFEMLSRIGFHVVVTNNGYEAVKLVESESFDGILMDLQMPGMDGYQTASLIHAKPGCKDIPIIAMSAAVMEEDKRKCINVGMVDHVAKPILPEALAGALSKWVKPARQGFAAVSPVVLPEPEGCNMPLNLPGFNIFGAIKRVGGNYKLLCKLLHQFSGDYSSVIERLENLTQACDVKGTLLVLHSLRGVSSSLGVSLVYEQALQLENRIKAGQFPVSFETLNHVLQEALTAISQTIDISEAPVNQLVEYDREDATVRLNELASSLKKHKIYPKESLDVLTAHLAVKVNPEVLLILCRHVDNFNYKGALAAVYEIAGKLKITINA